MCVFVVRQPDKAVEVGGTHIFARMDAQGRQWLAYEMSVRAPEDTAMVLPVPVALQDAAAFRFVNLEGYPTLFDDLAKAIYVWGWRRFDSMPTLGGGGGSRAPTLPVHQVGAYEASFVPDLAAFERLDARFALSPEVRRQLPDYSRFGFAVFKLAPTRGKRPERAHAMAFNFAARDPEALFFPTVHVHDGRWHEFASFDHMLYAQGATWQLPDEKVVIDGRETTAEKIQKDIRQVEAAERFEKRDGRMSGPYGVVRVSGLAVERGGQPVVAPARSAGLVDADQPIAAIGLSGRLPNADTWLRRGDKALGTTRASIREPSFDD